MLIEVAGSPLEAPYPGKFKPRQPITYQANYLGLANEGRAEMRIGGNGRG